MAKLIDLNGLQAAFDKIFDKNGDKYDTIKINRIPVSIQGGLKYKGTWNAGTKTTGYTAAVGDYWVCNVAANTNAYWPDGTSASTDFQQGDWAVCNVAATTSPAANAVWAKIDNSDKVSSVNGKTGAVTLTYTDVGAAASDHSHTWSTITDKPTNLSGYGITDAKIENGVITLGSNNITPLTSAATSSVLGGVKVTGNGGIKIVIPEAAASGETPGEIKLKTINNGGVKINDNGYVIADTAVLATKTLADSKVGTVEVTGTGNAVTTASIASGKLTLTKSETFLTSASIADKVSGPASAVDSHVAVFDGTTGKVIKDSGFTIAKSVPEDAKFTDTNTTYTFATGDGNGQIKVTPSSGSASNVSVKGLKSAAYTESTEYATSSHTHGNITSDGKIGTEAGKFAITDVDGVIKALAPSGALDFVYDGSDVTGVTVYIDDNTIKLNSNDELCVNTADTSPLIAQNIDNLFT